MCWAGPFLAQMQEQCSQKVVCLAVPVAAPVSQLLDVQQETE